MDEQTKTRLILTNAIYFKGKWAEEFDKTRTRDEPFHLAAGGKADVPMMHQTVDFGYADLGDAQILEMPYKGGEMSMVILLPRKVDGLPALEKSTSGAKLAEWIGKVKRMEVALALPRFKLEQRFEPKTQLEALGMKMAFVRFGADFSGMTPEGPLFIYKVVHRAFVDVNEEGTEAAAATAVVMAQPNSAPAPPKVFRADRPFLFLIRDAKRGTILFMGRMMNPKT